MTFHLIQVMIIGGFCYVAGFTSCMVIVICAQGGKKP